MNTGKKFQYLLSLTVSVVLALLFGAVIMAINGYNPADGYGALLQGAFGSKRAWGNTLYKTAQLAITGLATVIASNGGIFNVGGEGQMYLGALASAYIGARFAGLSPWIGVPLCMIAAVLAGSLYALIPALMKVKLKINEVITTILMNSVAIYFCSYMANGPLKTMERGVSQGTDAVDKAYRFAKLIPGSNLTQSVIWIAVLSLIVWYLMSRTTIGFEMKMTGHNSRFARFAGIKADQMAIWGMLISGALCGLLGMFETFGVQARFRPDFSDEFYFDGMLVAMIMGYRPLGTILMSFFFGALKIGAGMMQSMTGISSELIEIIQSIIIFFTAAENGIVEMIRLRRVQGRRRSKKAREAVK